MQNRDSRELTILLACLTAIGRSGVEFPLDKNQLEQQREKIIRLISRFQGELHEIKTGEVMASFAQASNAFLVATSLNRLFPGCNVRAGLHSGKVTMLNGKPGGAVINLTSRLPQYSRPGGVCLSEAVFHYLDRKDQDELIELRKTTIKNFRPGLRCFVSLPEGQSPRSRQSEFRRHLKQNFLRINRYFFPSCLLVFAVSAVAIHMSATPETKPARVSIHVPEFTRQIDHHTSELDGIEFAVRARIAGASGVAIHANQEAADYRVQIDLKLSGAALEATYHISRLRGVPYARKGRVKADTGGIFMFQDNLAASVLRDLAYLHVD